MDTYQICIRVLLLAALSQVVLCSIHDRSSPSSNPHLPLVYAARHDDEDTSSREVEPLSPGSQCLADNYHYPHHCKVPDCDFMVAWRETGGKDGDAIVFDLKAKVTDSSMVWAAIGFSEDAKMRGSDGVICYVKEDEGVGEIHLGVIQPRLKRTVKIMDDVKDALSDTSVQVKDNKLHCRFSRKKSITDDTLKWKSLIQSWHILVATGQLDIDRDTNATKILHHTKKAASNCKCNVSLCTEECDCPDGIRYQLLKLHGVLMSVAFIFFIPTGALLSRYYKMVFSSSWLKGHIAMMVIGILWALIGFGMVLGHTGGVFSIGIHQLVGITCLSLVVLQPIVGFLRPPVQRTIRRVIFVAFHKSMAIFIVATSCVALFMGTYIFCNPVMVWIMAVLGLAILTNLGFILLLEILTRTHKFSTAPPVGYHKVTKNDDLSESEEEVFVRDDPNKKTKGTSGKGSSAHQAFKMEKTLLVIYILQSFGFAVLVAALLYYFDSHKHGD